MKKKFLTTLFVMFLIGMMTIGFFGCVEKNPYPDRQHITMLIVDNDLAEREDAFCEFTEKENRKTIEIKYDGKYRQLRALALFPDGKIKQLSGKDCIGMSVDQYTSPDGEINYNPYSEIHDIGVYEITFLMNSDNERAFPFEANLTVKVIPKEKIHEL